MDDIIEYFLNNLKIYSKESVLYINNQTALLAALISTREFKEEPLKSYLSLLVEEYFDSSKQLVYRLSLFEAYSRKHKLSYRQLDYALDIGNQHLKILREDKTRHLISFILKSIFHCNAEVGFEIYHEKSDIWVEELLRVFYEEENTFTLITEDAMKKGNYELLSKVLFYNEDVELNSIVRSEFLRKYGNDVDENILKRLVVNLEFDATYPMPVISWIIFYSEAQKLKSIDSFIKRNFDVLTKFPHSILSILNKLGLKEEDKIDELIILQNSYLTGKDECTELFSQCLERRLIDIENFNELDLSLLKKANFNIHPAFEQKFFCRVKLDVTAMNHRIWLKIIDRMSDINLIPNEIVKTLAFNFLSDTSLTEERIELMSRKQLPPNGQFLEALSFEKLEIKQRIKLCEFCCDIYPHVSSYYEEEESNRVRFLLKRIIETMLDDKKFVVRQAAAKAMEKMIAG